MDTLEFLRSRIFGQEQVIRPLQRALDVAARRIDPPTPQPLGAWLLLGPTGVGKTEAVKAVTERIWGVCAEGAAAHLARFDMAEFADADSMALMLGSATEQGRLGDAIDHLNSMGGGVILLDEIEKSHRHFHRLFLSACDEGHITMFNGSRKDLSWIIICMTSNLGAEKVGRLGEGSPTSSITRAVESEARSCFGPEGLQRFGLTLIFRRLSAEVQRGICEKLAREYIERSVEPLLKNNARRVPLSVLLPSSAVLRALAKAGYSDRFGARNMRRTVQSSLGHALNSFLSATPSEEIFEHAVSGKVLRLATKDASGEDTKAGLMARELFFEVVDPGSGHQLVVIDEDGGISPGISSVTPRVAV